jgi:hypothetical protein
MSIERPAERTSFYEAVAPPEIFADGSNIASDFAELADVNSAEALDIDEARQTVDNLFVEPADTNRGGAVAQASITLDLPAAVEAPATDSRPPQATGFISRLKEALGPPRLNRRTARPEDLETLVDIDMWAFGSVYRDYDIDNESLRAELKDKFADRLEKLGSGIQLVEIDERVCGFITSCPTSKEPNTFKSWEDTTDNGTLETTYDPHGDYLYIVTLSMVSKGSAEKAQNMLVTHAIGKLVSEGYKQAYFESRMPGLRSWVKRQCREQGLDINQLKDEQKDLFANTYFGLATHVNGKEVPKDVLLRMYKAIGCNLIKVVPNAYKDKPSMDYGVVCTFDNPLPEFLRKNRVASKLVGGLIKLVSKSSMITERLYR